MKKLLTLAFCTLLSVACYAQNTTVTATVTDGDSVTWANATWTIDFVPGIQFPSPSQYTINGSALSSSVTHQTGSLNSSGALSVVVYDSSIVTPTGSGWRLNICPLTSGNCITYQFSTAGGSQSISSNLTTTIGSPRFPCPQICRGYNTIEATGMVAGSIFYNTTPGTSTSCNQYTGTSWSSCAVGVNSGGGVLLCKLSSPVSNTGNTSTNTYLPGTACQIPAGTLGANSQIYITATYTRSSGTGNCTGSIWEATTSGTLTNLIGATNATANFADVKGYIINVNSLTSQNLGGTSVGNGFATSTGLVTSSINTATTPIFINAAQSNSIGTDNCSIISEIVSYVP